MSLFEKIKDNAKSLSQQAMDDAQKDAQNVENAVGDLIQPQPELAPEAAEDPDFDPFDAVTPIPPDPQEVENAIEQDRSNASEETSIAVGTKPQPKTDKKDSTKSKDDHKSTKVIVGGKKPDAHPGHSAPKARLIDIAPQMTDKVQAKRDLLVKERAVLQTISNQRRLTGAIPVFTTEHLKFRVRVFINRIEYIGGFGKINLPIESIVWVKLRAGGTGIIFETIDNKRVVVVVKPADRIKLAETIFKIQQMQPALRRARTKGMSVRELEKVSLGSDEIEKLADLREKGLLTDEEFNLKKRQILGLKT